MPRMSDENTRLSTYTFYRLKKTPADVFGKHLARIRFIQEIQRDLNGARHAEQKFQFLNQSYILHLVAEWQVFCEELVLHGFRALEVRESTGVLHELAKARMENALARFNTPNQKNIDQLFKETLNIPKISQCWSWYTVTPQAAAETLNIILKARHEIAHSGTTEEKLSYEKNYEYMETLVGIAQFTEDAMNKQLKIE